MDDQLKKRFKTYSDPVQLAVKEERWTDVCSIIVGGLEEARKNKEHKLSDLLLGLFKAQLVILVDIYGSKEYKDEYFKHLDEPNDKNT